MLLLAISFWLYFLLQEKDTASAIKQTAQRPAKDISWLDSLQFTHPVAVALREQLETEIIGQKGLINGLILGLIAGKHVFVQSLPGMAKTTAVKALAQASGLSFGRIQGTPDLLPSDIIGIETIAESGKLNSAFGPAGAKGQVIRKWPLFANIILFDEINRTTPKVQSALMECMQEGQVTIGHQTLELPKPFLVFATANPSGSKGVYDLPEAQLDRFGLSIVLDYPDNERDILKTPQQQMPHNKKKQKNAVDFESMYSDIEGIRISDASIDIINWIIQKTRQMPDAIVVGCSPRAAKDLLWLAKTTAYLSGGQSVEESHIMLLLESVLVHRMIRKKGVNKKDVLMILHSM